MGKKETPQPKKISVSRSPCPSHLHDRHNIQIIDKFKLSRLVL